MQTIFRVCVVSVGELAFRLMLLSVIFKRSAVGSIYRPALETRPLIDFSFAEPSELESKERRVDRVA